MSPRLRSGLLRYGAAILFTGIALGVKLLLVPLITLDAPFLLFFGAVMAAAAFGGFGPGLLATVLTTFFNNYIFMRPYWRFQLESPDQRIRLALFVVEGAFISLICARFLAARRRVDAASAEARALERRILEISDAEQRRIGHDLHDGLGQHLTGITMMLRRHQQELEASGAPSAEAAGKVFDLAQAAVEWTHDLSRSLSPPALETEGLAEALRELASRAENLFRITCAFEQSGEANEVDLAAGVHLYRIAQEAISNAVKHGEAKNVWLRLEGSKRSVELQVIDDGTGIELPAESSDGMGLRIMQYRAKMIGATMDVRHHEGGGTIVTCRYMQG